jgi:hypothetical protein
MSTDYETTFVWPFDFACTIVNEKLIVPNHYSLKVSIEPVLPIHESIGIAFQKMKLLVANSLSNSIFINQKNTLLDTLKDTDTNIVELPSEPYDYYVGSIIFFKLMALTEKYFDISQITIDSAIGDRVEYTVRDPYSSGLDLDGDYWWNQDNAGTNPRNLITWEDLDLGEKSNFRPFVVKGGLSEH